MLETPKEESEDSTARTPSHPRLLIPLGVLLLIPLIFAGFIVSTFVSTAHERVRGRVLVVINSTGYEPPPPELPPSCHAVGYNPQLPTKYWLFNSRAFCLTSAVCIRPQTPEAAPQLYFAADPSRATCPVRNPDLSRAPSDIQASLNCQHLAEKDVFCAHGSYIYGSRASVCPPIQRITKLGEADEAAAIWLAPDRVAVVMPAFPWTRNIFHWAFVASHMAHVASNLDMLFTSVWTRDTPEARDQANQTSQSLLHAPQRISVIFRETAPGQLKTWIATITAILLRRRVTAAGVHDITVHHLDENPKARATNVTHNPTPLLCAHAAVLTGERGDLNFWPFPNGSAIAVTGDSVPAQSIALRRAVYEEYALPIRTPKLLGAVSLTATNSSRASEAPVRSPGFEPSFVFDAPPLVLGYSRRMLLSDPPAGQLLSSGWRRFSDADERWFRKMLNREARRASAGRVRVIEVDDETPVGEQVRRFAEVGVLVGIHGANLVNSMFMPPFGVLVEVTPSEHRSTCYHAGGNVGLAYALHEADPATRKESYCGEKAACWDNRKQRRVKVASRNQRDKLRAAVRKALERVAKLRKAFPSGVPTTLELPEEKYIIDWSQEGTTA